MPQNTETITVTTNHQVSPHDSGFQSVTLGSVLTQSISGPLMSPTFQPLKSHPARPAPGAMNHKPALTASTGEGSRGLSAKLLSLNNINLNATVPTTQSDWYKNCDVVSDLPVSSCSWCLNFMLLYLQRSFIIFLDIMTDMVSVAGLDE